MLSARFCVVLSLCAACGGPGTSVASDDAGTGTGTEQFDAGVTSDVGSEGTLTIKDIDAGDFHSCILIEPLGLKCWGAGSFGALGHGNEEGILSIAEGPPVPVEFPVVDVEVGKNFTCVIHESGTVRCWGLATDGALGAPVPGHIGDDEPASDAPLLDFGTPALQLDAGTVNVCVVLSDQTVHCWGGNNIGQLGLGHTNTVGDDESATDAPALALPPVSAVSVGDSHACALTLAGDVFCWGASSLGALGDPGHACGPCDQDPACCVGDDEDLSGLDAIPLPEPALSIHAGQGWSCALLADGDAWCWGANQSGQLGLGHEQNIGDDEPVASSGPVVLGGPTAQLASGRHHACSIGESGVRCWGDGEWWKLGTGTANDLGDDEFPSGAAPVALPMAAQQLALGGEYSCAVIDERKLFCWGRGAYMGRGNLEDIGDDETPEGLGLIPLD